MLKIISNSLDANPAKLPLVTVCICTYNHEKYVAEAIDSVLQQTYQNIEILLLDDASTDNTALIVKSYADKNPEKIKAIFLDVNGGASAACNRVFFLAAGEFVAFLGSDDRMRPLRIEKQVEFLLQNPGCVGVFTDICVIDQQGRSFERSVVYENFFNRSLADLRINLLSGNFLNSPSAMVRRDDMRATGGYNPLLRYVHDYDFWGKLLARGELGKIPQVLTDYRVHGHNLSVGVTGEGGVRLNMEIVSVIIGFVRTWTLEMLAGIPVLTSFQKRDLLLELIQVLELVDRKYLKVPANGCALAYDLSLQVAWIDSVKARQAQARIEKIFSQGFSSVELPFSGETPIWLKSPARSLGVNFNSGLSLDNWLARRVLTPVQVRLIEDVSRGQQVSLSLFIFWSGENVALLRQTIDSLANSSSLVRINPLVVLASDSGFHSECAEFKDIEFISSTVDSFHALNACISSCTSDWVLQVQAGEELRPSGSTMLGLESSAANACNALFFDEVYSQDGSVCGIALRPSFNLDYFLSFPSALSRHWLLRPAVVNELGGFSDHCGGSHEFDLILRMLAKFGTDGIGHIAEPLVQCSSPCLIDSGYERRALVSHLKQRGYEHCSVGADKPGRYRIDYGHAHTPLVSFLIVAGDRLHSLQRCIESILENTRYPYYELLIIQYYGQPAEVSSWLSVLEGLGETRIRIMTAGGHKDSRQMLINQAAFQANGDYVLLFSADAAAVSEEWLSELLNHGQRPEVGCVGPKFLSSDGKIAQAGLILGLTGPIGYPDVGESLDAPGYMQRLQVVQNSSVIGHECLLVEKKLYLALGGLSESSISFRHAGADLCLKARQAGYLTVWTPFAQLMLDRVDTTFDSVADQDAMYAKWLQQLRHDPIYNPNFSLAQPGGFKLADTALSWRPLASWKSLVTVLAHPSDNYGSGHYRVIQPFTALQEAGLIQGALSSGLMHVTDLGRYDPDVVVLQKQIGNDRFEAMRRMQAFSRALKVYELDDYLPNLPVKSVHRAQMPKDILKSMRRGLSYVDRFVVSTQALAEACGGLHDDIRVIENYLPPAWWKGLASPRSRSGKPRVGWAGGISHTGDLEMIADVVQALADEVDWVFMGMCPEKLRPFVKEIHQGVDILAYPRALAALNLDLAVAPLEENPFNQCKSNLRLLEYGACGFPVVCSDVRSYEGSLPVTRVKNRYRDWAEAIRMHVADLDASAHAGSALHQQVMRDWMLEGGNLIAWRHAWLPD
ncbi:MULTISPECIES: glycosyltransferase [Pseudomonas]|uniref:glycosyltransferase n=1 Tax=Pseudomonas TaxID=286 RepID=UPI0018CF470D|nr:MULTISPECIES: glycosyltransferase [Pseudomonas]